MCVQSIKMCAQYESPLKLLQLIYLVVLIITKITSECLVDMQITAVTNAIVCPNVCLNFSF